MRKRFEPQRQTDQLLIEDTPTPRSRDGLAHLVIALRELYGNSRSRNQILDILEEKILKCKRFPCLNRYIFSNLQKITNTAEVPQGRHLIISRFEVVIMCRPWGTSVVCTHVLLSVS
jgi:hypothetical protein